MVCQIAAEKSRQAVYTNRLRPGVGNNLIRIT